jgi:hypothetical protein
MGPTGSLDLSVDKGYAKAALGNRLPIVIVFSAFSHGYEITDRL